jgi:hypothetical protein
MVIVIIVALMTTLTMRVMMMMIIINTIIIIIAYIITVIAVRASFSRRPIVLPRQTTHRKIDQAKATPRKSGCRHTASMNCRATLALSEGVPTKTHVLNLLHRLVDGKVVGVPPLDTPQALALRREPKANVERYDGLRAQIAGGRHASCSSGRRHRHHAAQPEDAWDGPSRHRSH